MKLLISPQETLIYYDGPQLFVAADKVGARYLCVLVEQNVEGDKCLCVPVSPRRLAELKLGNIELRSIYESPEMGSCFCGSITGDYGTITLESVEKVAIPEGWLPAPGFYFTKTPENVEGVQKAALDQNRAIVDVSVNPPEARGESRITPSHLMDVLESFQLAVKYAYKRTLRGDKTISEDLKSPTAHAMNVAAFSPGSFKIRFESVESGDLVNYVNLSRALKKLDELTEHLDDPQAALEVLRQNEGHLASAYLRLLESIIENDAPFAYSWGVPDGEKPITRQISKEQAIPLYELFRSQSELTRVEIDVVGYVIKANWKTGTWTLRQEDGKEVSGRIHEENDQDLAGIVLKDKKYLFRCLETIEEMIGTGRKRTNLFLLHYRESI